MIRKAYADTAAGQVHYHCIDGPGLPLVLLHQTASSGKMFHAVMQRLSGSRALYAFDTPGFGGSFDPPEAPSMTQYADWLMAAMDAAGLKRFHLLGHHTGAFIGVELASKYPDAVASLGLIGPMPMSAEERRELRAQVVYEMPPTTDGSYLKDTWAYLVLLGADADLALQHREMVDTLRAYRGRLQAYNAVFDQGFQTLFMGVGCPLLIACGEGNAVWPFFERARELRPDATVAVLGGDNLEPDLDPDGTAAAISSFLEQVEV